MYPVKIKKHRRYETMENLRSTKTLILSIAMSQSNDTILTNA